LVFVVGFTNKTGDLMEVDGISWGFMVISWNLRVILWGLVTEKPTFGGDTPN